MLPTRTITQNRSSLALRIAAGSALSLGLAAAALLALPAQGDAQPSKPLTRTDERSRAAEPGQAQDAPSPALADDRVPVRKITLYRSGVGYFERSGSIDGNAELQLRFKTDQINDILKSMILLDLDGGRIESVGYGSKEPLERRLASFGVNIAGNPSIPELLGQLRGARVELVIGSDRVTGTILGVENRTTSPSKDIPAIMMPHLNLVTETGLRSVAISDISSFEILDKELAGELNKALATLSEYRADRSKAVDLRFAGAGSRRVVVGYVHETPVWKTSYRLILPDADGPKGEGGEAAAGEDKPKGHLVMQGWAIVENTTDQDWTDVRLSLVSGRPVSFQMDLYEPLFTFRPMIPVPTIPGVMPRAYAEGMDLDFKDALQEQAAGARDRFAAEKSDRSEARRSRAGAPPAPASPAPRMAGRAVEADMAAGFVLNSPDITADDLANYAAQSQAQGTEVGEVFQYQIETPVTVERQRSAMIPILAANITGRRVSIYSLADAQRGGGGGGAEGALTHPMRGVELVNESGLQLLPGPIAVFDGAAYAGDAQINHIAKGDKRLLSYSLDLDVAVLTKPQQDSRLTKITIADGQLIQTTSTTNSVSYAFDNKDAARDRTIIVEHPRLDGWTLTEPKKALEETTRQYRFEVLVAAAKKATFSVTQERTDRQAVAVTSIDLPTLVSYHKSGKLSDAVLKAARDVAAKQSAINTAERGIAELDRQSKEIADEQTRIRGNMNTIDRASQLYTRYMTKLSDQESQLETLRERRITANEQLEALRADLNTFLRTLNAD